MWQSGSTHWTWFTIYPHKKITWLKLLLRNASHFACVVFVYNLFIFQICIFYVSIKNVFVRSLSSCSILNPRFKVPILCCGYVCTVVSNNIMVVQIVHTSQKLLTRMETSPISAGDLDLVLTAKGHWAVRWVFFFKKSRIHRIWLNIISLTRGFVFFFLVVSYEGLAVLFDKHGVLESSLSRTLTGSTQMKNTLLMK